MILFTGDRNTHDRMERNRHTNVFDGNISYLVPILSHALIPSFNVNLISTRLITCGKYTQIHLHPTSEHEKYTFTHKIYIRSYEFPQRAMCLGAHSFVHLILARYYWMNQRLRLNIFISIMKYKYKYFVICDLFWCDSLTIDW